MEYYQKDDRVIPYQIIYKNNKNTYFRIKDGYVEVTTNKRYKHLIASYFDMQFDKLYRKLNTVIKNNDDEISLWGKKYKIVSEFGKFSYHIVDDIIYINSNDDIDKTKKQIYARELENMLEILNPKINQVIARRGLTQLSMKLKFLKSKFGSYHRKHDEITLNTFLATLDPIFLEYVLYHEYAHKIVFNHSPAFYAVLDDFMINHKKIQKAIKKIAII